MAGPLGINAGGPERIVNPLHYRPISVVTLNHSLDIDHARLPIIVNAVWPDRPYYNRYAPIRRSAAAHSASSLTLDGS
jgi:hypothetical protein